MSRRPEGAPAWCDVQRLSRRHALATGAKFEWRRISQRQVANTPNPRSQDRPRRNGNPRRSLPRQSVTARVEVRRLSRRGDATRIAATPRRTWYEAVAGAAWSRIFPGRLGPNHGTVRRDAESRTEVGYLLRPVRRAFELDGQQPVPYLHGTPLHRASRPSGWRSCSNTSRSLGLPPVPASQRDRHGPLVPDNGGGSCPSDTYPDRLGMPAPGPCEGNCCRLDRVTATGLAARLAPNGDGKRGVGSERCRGSRTMR